MSLLSELNDRDSPVKRFFRETFPNTREPLSQVRSALRGNELIHRLDPGAPPHAYAQIGTAIDYRIRYSFAPTPAPYLIAWRGAWAIADDAQVRQFRTEGERGEVPGGPPADDAHGAEFGHGVVPGRYCQPRRSAAAFRRLDMPSIRFLESLFPSGSSKTTCTCSGNSLVSGSTLRPSPAHSSTVTAITPAEGCRCVKCCHEASAPIWSPSYIDNLPLSFGVGRKTWEVIWAIP